MAGLGAEAAVFVHLRMPLALLRTAVAGFRAHATDLLGERSTTRHRTHGCRAHLGTVAVETNACDKL